MGKIVGLVFADEAVRLACPHCGKEYKTEEALAKHIVKEHPAAGAGSQPPAPDKE